MSFRRTRHPMTVGSFASFFGITPSTEVTSRLNTIDDEVTSLDTDVQTCAGTGFAQLAPGGETVTFSGGTSATNQGETTTCPIGADDLAAWNQFVTGWKASASQFSTVQLATDSSVLDSTEAELIAWQAKFKALGVQLSSPTFKPTGQPGGTPAAAFPWTLVIAAVIVVAVAMVVLKTEGLVKHNPRRRLNPSTRGRRRRRR